MISLTFWRFVSLFVCCVVWWMKVSQTIFLPALSQISSLGKGIYVVSPISNLRQWRSNFQEKKGSDWKHTQPSQKRKPHERDSHFAKERNAFWQVDLNLFAEDFGFSVIATRGTSSHVQNSSVTISAFTAQTIVNWFGNGCHFDVIDNHYLSSQVIADY